MVQTVYSDFDIEFRQNDLTGDVIIKKNTESIKQSLALLFKTKYYDRKWHPEIGSYFSALLFSPNDDFAISVAKTEVENLINRYEPRINLKNIDFYYPSDSAKERGELNISIEYEIVILGVLDKFVYKLSRIR